MSKQKVNCAFSKKYIIDILELKYRDRKIIFYDLKSYFHMQIVLKFSILRFNYLRCKCHISYIELV